VNENIGSGTGIGTLIPTCPRVVKMAYPGYAKIFFKNEI